MNSKEVQKITARYMAIDKACSMLYLHGFLGEMTMRRMKKRIVKKWEIELRKQAKKERAS